MIDEGLGKKIGQDVRLRVGRPSHEQGSLADVLQLYFIFWMLFFLWSLDI